MTLSAKEIVSYVPARFKDVPDGPVFSIRGMSVLERLQYNRDISAAGVRRPQDAELIEQLRAGVDAIIVEDDRPALHELIDRAEAKLLDDDEKKNLEQLEGVMHSNWPGYAKLRAEREYHMQMAPIMAFRRFVKGWDNLDVKMKRTGALIDEDVLEEIGLETVIEVGWAVLLRSSLNEADAKKSQSPSASGENPQPSAADGQPMEAQAGASAA